MFNKYILISALSPAEVKGCGDFELRDGVTAYMLLPYELVQLECQSNGIKWIATCDNDSGK